MLDMLIACTVAFCVGLFAVSKSIIFFENVGIAGVDIQKKNKPKIPEMGGLPVVIAFISGALAFIGFNTLTSSNIDLPYIFAALLTIIIIMLIGMIDDMTVLIKRDPVSSASLKIHKREGLKQYHKFLLPLPAAVPLIVMNIGISTMSFPLIGNIDIGLLYPFLMVPLAVFGASNATNMLAGLNGLEASMGVVLISSLGIFSMIHGNYSASLIAFVFVCALLAFLVYNRYPSKIFPGDSLTYTIGAVAAIVAVVGNIEKFAVFCFIPWFIEFVLKSRSSFKAESFGVLQTSGTLKSKYKKIYSLPHLVMGLGDFNEIKIVSILVLFEILVCIVAFLLFM